MKKLLLLFGLLTTVSGLLARSDSAFVRAVESYDRGNFEESLELFRKIADNGETSAVLYYNMGNAAYRSNQLGYAVLYYEKALKEDPGMENAAVNLEFVSRYLEDHLESVPELFVRTWVKSLVRMFNAGTWAVISAVLFVLTLLALTLYIFSRRLTLRKTGFFGALSVFVLFVLALLAGIRQHRRDLKPEEAVIISPSVIVRSTPNNSGNELFILHEGTTVSLQDELSGWQNIRISDGRVGWIEITDAEPV
ncbi:MAG: tetratricopeptide repeat protein [Bacteroidota bacterium]